MKHANMSKVLVNIYGYAIMVTRPRKGIKMYRDEAVQLMCDTVNNYNRSLVDSGAISLTELEQFIEQGAEQLNFMNGLLYDTLKDHGVIS